VLRRGGYYRGWVFAVGGWGSLFRCRCGGRRRRNREGEGRGGEGRQRGDILTFTDRITDIIFSSVIPLAILPVKGSLLNPSVIPLVKSPAKTSTSLTCFFFFKILYILFVILSVYTDRIIPSVYTDRITEGFTSVGNYHHKLRIEK
jgi:hypothetical protein